MTHLSNSRVLLVERVITWYYPVHVNIKWNAIAPDYFLSESPMLFLACYAEPDTCMLAIIIRVILSQTHQQIHVYSILLQCDVDLQCIHPRIMQKVTQLQRQFALFPELNLLQLAEKVWSAIKRIECMLYFNYWVVKCNRLITQLNDAREIQNAFNPLLNFDQIIPLFWLRNFG